MSRSKFGTPRAREGELKLQYGHSADDGDGLFYIRGDGVAKADAHMLHDVVSRRQNPSQFALAVGHDSDPEFSFLEELDRRGYDITTLKISVQKK